MYIIIQGDCDISMMCHDGVINYGDNLVKGEHFGEVRMLYDCPRTATVQSMSYNIMGQLDKQKYQNIINLYPKFDDLMRKNMHSYLDPFKNFFYNCFQKFSYFQDIKDKSKTCLNQDQFHQLLYLFKQTSYSKGDTIIKEMQATDKIYIVSHGNITFEANIEGVKDFELLNLGPGSIINHRNVFIDSELFWFHAYATTDTIVFEIHKDSLTQFQKEHQILGRQIDIAIANIVKSKKRFVIDVIPGIPPKEKGTKVTSERRSIAFKNVAFLLMLEEKFKNFRQKQLISDIQNRIKQVKATGIPTGEVDENGEPKRIPCDMKKKDHRVYIKQLIIQMQNDNKESSQNVCLGEMLTYVEKFNFEFESRFKTVVEMNKEAREALVLRPNQSPKRHFKLTTDEESKNGGDGIDLHRAGIPRIESEERIMMEKKVIESQKQNIQVPN